MLIIWKERLKQVAITMIIITPFLVERVCYVMIWVMNVLSGGESGVRSSSKGMKQ